MESFRAVSRNGCSLLFLLNFKVMFFDDAEETLSSNKSVMYFCGVVSKREGF